MPWAASAAGVVFPGSRGFFLGVSFCPLLPTTPTPARSQKPLQALPVISQAQCSSPACSQGSSPTSHAHVVSFPRSPRQSFLCSRAGF